MSNPQFRLAPLAGARVAGKRVAGKADGLFCRVVHYPAPPGSRLLGREQENSNEGANDSNLLQMSNALPEDYGSR